MVRSWRNQSRPRCAQRAFSIARENGDCRRRLPGVRSARYPLLTYRFQSRVRLIHPFRGPAGRTKSQKAVGAAAQRGLSTGTLGALTGDERGHGPQSSCGVKNHQLDPEMLVVPERYPGVNSEANRRTAAEDSYGSLVCRNEPATSLFVGAPIVGNSLSLMGGRRHCRKCWFIQKPAPRVAGAEV